MPRMVAQMMTEMMQVRSGPAPDAFLEKLNENHIDKLIDLSHRSDTEKGRLYFATIIAVLVLVLGICWMFLAYDQSQEVSGIIGVIIGAVGGFGVGYGIRRK